MSVHVAPPPHETLHGEALQTTSHVEFPEQETDDDAPSQVMLHVDPLVHVTLPDCPTDSVHVEESQFTLPLSPVDSVQLLWLVHEALHAAAHVPWQVALLVQASEQPALPAPQLAVPAKEQSGPGQGPP